VTDDLSIQVSTATWAVARPLMQTDRWCVNAAAITKLVLAQLGVKSYPVHAEVMHLNAAAAHGADGSRPLPPADSADPYMVYARLDNLGADDIGAEDANSPEGLAGHVLTFVPEWRCYLDPSGHQFTRPDWSIVVPVGAVWHSAPEPPAPAVWERPDGGVSVIEPTRSRRFVHAAGWKRRDYHDVMAREIVRLVREGGDGSDG